MKLIKPKYEIIEQGPGLDGIYKAIEDAGRTCYKSIGTRYFKILINGTIVPDVWHYLKLDTTCKKFLRTESKNSEVPNKIHIINGYVSIADKDVKYFEGLEKYESEFNPKFHKNVTAEDFVNRMIKSGHHAMLEFGTVYLRIPWINSIEASIFHYTPFTFNKYSVENTVGDYNYVTSNYRVIIENKLEDWLQYLCEPTEYHEKRVCVRFTTDRGISHELVRHRVFSFAQESTRYCNYSKDKFGNELTFIIPYWLDVKECAINSIVMSGQLLLASNTNSSINFIQALNNTELNYFELLKKGHTPQEARQVLPNALKTEINMCGFVSDWKHFFSFRSSHAGAEGMHPGMNYIANKVYDEFLKRKWINL